VNIKPVLFVSLTIAFLRFANVQYVTIAFEHEFALTQNCFNLVLITMGKQFRLARGIRLPQSVGWSCQELWVHMARLAFCFTPILLAISATLF